MTKGEESIDPEEFVKLLIAKRVNEGTAYELVLEVIETEYLVPVETIFRIIIDAFSI